MGSEIPGNNSSQILQISYVITSTTPPRDLVRLPSQTCLGPYRILSAIGAGSTGEVYRAVDTRLSLIVALKVVSKALVLSEIRRAQFEFEARTVMAIHHPHISSLLDLDSACGVPFLVMAYLDGETLEDRLRRGPLPVDDALRHARELADAIATMHRAGIVHRELTPANVMLTTSGVKLLDAGTAALAPTAEELVGMERVDVDSTLPYLPPELLRGDSAGYAADLYAIGAVLYEMIGGKPAFRSTSIEQLMSAILNVPPAPLRSSIGGLSSALDHIARKCLSKRAYDRHASASALLEELCRLRPVGREARGC